MDEYKTSAELDCERFGHEVDYFGTCTHCGAQVESDDES